MVSNYPIITELKMASLYAEESKSDSSVINGGAEIKDVRGIRIFSRGFSVEFINGYWLVKLPRGQLFDEHIVTESSDVAPLVIKHYKNEGFIS